MDLAAFRHSFGQSQLSVHASILVTFGNFKILVGILVVLNECYALNVSETCSKAESQRDPRKMTLAES